MQLFIRGTQTHVVEVTGTETVSDVKVGVTGLQLRRIFVCLWVGIGVKKLHTVKAVNIGIDWDRIASHC